MTDKKEEEEVKEVSGWGQLELSAQIIIIIIIIMIGFPITVGFFLYIAHKYKVHRTDKPKQREQIKNIGIDKVLSCSNIKLKTVSKIPEVTKPCSCYFYDLRTDFKLFGCTDKNNVIRYPDDINKINSLTHSNLHTLPHSNPHTLPNPHPHSNSHTRPNSLTIPHSNSNSKSLPKLVTRPNPLPNIGTHNHTHT